jgi:hypothetical protein
MSATPSFFILPSLWVLPTALLGHAGTTIVYPAEQVNPAEGYRSSPSPRSRWSGFGCHGPSRDADGAQAQRRLFAH